MKRSFKQWLSGWKADDFFRQLATVVIGIVITFGGSGLIQKSAQKREARAILEMVRVELDQNIEGVENYCRAFELDIAGCRALAPWIVSGRPEQIPLDTLAAYRSVLVMHASYTPVTNSFETLKGSQITKSLGNNELMNALYDIYSDLDNADNADFLMRDKFEGMKRLFASLDAQTLNDFYTPEGLRDYFVRLATRPEGGEMRFYIITVANGNNHGNLKIAEVLIAKIRGVQQMIDKEVGTPTAD